MGASWMNTLLGIVVIVGDIGAFIAKFMTENSAPLTISDWLVYGMGLATGIGLIVSKQFNVSNAQQPAKATVVSAVDEAKVNPASKVVG